MSTVYLDRGGGAALKFDQDVGGVDGLRWVGVLQRLDGLVHVACSRGVHLHRLVRPAGPHEPARDVQVVDGWIFLFISTTVARSWGQRYYFTKLSSVDTHGD